MYFHLFFPMLWDYEYFGSQNCLILVGFLAKDREKSRKRMGGYRALGNKYTNTTFRPGSMKLLADWMWRQPFWHCRGMCLENRVLRSLSYHLQAPCPAQVLAQPRPCTSTQAMSCNAQELMRPSPVTAQTISWLFEEPMEITGGKSFVNHQVQPKGPRQCWTHHEVNITALFLDKLARPRVENALAMGTNEVSVFVQIA